MRKIIDWVSDITLKKMAIILLVGFVIGVLLALLIDSDINRQIDLKKRSSIQTTQSSRTQKAESSQRAEEHYQKRNENYELKLFMEETDKNVREMQQYLVHKDFHSDANRVIASKSVLDRYQRNYEQINDKVLSEYIKEDKEQWEIVEKHEKQWDSLEWKKLKLRHEELIIQAKSLQLKYLE